jgi:hypothetical protein
LNDDKKRLVLGDVLLYVILDELKVIHERINALLATQ